MSSYWKAFRDRGLKIPLLWEFKKSGALVSTSPLNKGFLANFDNFFFVVVEWKLV